MLGVFANSLDFGGSKYEKRIEPNNFVICDASKVQIYALSRSTSHRHLHAV